MMMHGNNHDLGAGRAIDDRVREPSHQTATMFTMYLAEALGMLANRVDGSLDRPSELKA